MKITDVKLIQLKELEFVGSIEPAWNKGGSMRFSRGGGFFTEVHTDEGIVGIGPGMDPSLVEPVKNVVVGEDPFEIEQIVPKYDVVFTNDEFTKTLFEKRQINVIQVMLKDREKFSGTNIRQLILDGESWQDLVPQGTRKVLNKINATDRLKNL